MKRIKKITALLLCLLMVITAMPFTSLAEDEHPTDPALIADEDKFTDIYYDFEFNYDLEADAELVQDLGLTYHWDVASRTLYVDGVEPNTTLEYYNFNFNYQKFYIYNESELIEQQTEYNNYDLGVWVDFEFEGLYMEHVVIGENITTIKNVELDDYANLIDIKAIDNHPGIVLDNSPDLIMGICYVDLPISDTVLGERAFAEQTYDSIVLPSFVSELGDECFYNADIRIIDLSQTCITSIPNYCFYGVKNLETVLLPPCIESIGGAAFMYSDIEYITLPSSVVSMSDYVFNQCPRLKSADLSRTNVKELKNTFYGCNSLTDVLLPPALEKIDGAFNNCTSLKHLDIPESVAYLSGFGNTQITDFIFNQNLQYVELGSAVKTEKIDLSNCLNLLEVPEHAFYKNTTLKKVILPQENLEIIGNAAFQGCSNLEKVMLYSCAKIDSSAFAYTNLSEIEIPDNCTSIGRYAFRSCENLKEIRFPMDLEIINAEALCDCDNLETVIFPSRNKLVSSKGMENSGFGTRTSLFYRKGFLLGENVVVYLYPDTEIEQYCQNYGIAYEYIDWDLERNTTVINGVTPNKEYTAEGTIGSGTFVISTTGTQTKFRRTVNAYIEIEANGTLETTDIVCSNGTEATLSEIMKYYDVEYIKFAQSTTAIADGVFENFADNGISMLSVYFPASVRNIGENAFRNSGIYDVYFEENYMAADYRVELGKYAFADNSQLMWLVLSNKTKEIKEGTFYNTALISYTRDTGFTFEIPESVTKLGKKAFSNFNRERVWVSNVAQNGTNLHNAKVCVTTTWSSVPGGVNYKTGPVKFIVPKTVKEIYYDPEHPEDNAIAVTDEGYADEWICLHVSYGSAAYQYAKMFGLKYYLINTDSDGTETEEEMNAAPLHDISNPSPAPYIEETVGIISNETLIESETNSNMKWSYQPITKTLTLNSTSPGKKEFNSYNLYYEDGTQVQQGDFEVDTLIIKGYFSRLYGATRTVQNQYSTTTIYYPTPVSFFNPKYIDLSNVTITQLYDEAFKDCTRLESITVQANPRNIGKNLFENTPALRKVTFGSNVTSVPAGFLKSHKGVQFVEFPETLTSIGANAFNGCTNLQKIEIPDSCVAIGMNAFKSCVNVLSVTLGSGLNQIGKEAFADLINCEQITVKTDKIRTDASVIGIDYRNIFTNLGIMTGGITVNYADGLSTADFKVFDDKKVTKIVLGDDIETLKNADCLKALSTIELGRNNDSFFLIDGALYSSDLILALVPRTLESFNIANGCKGIGENAFNFSAISTITVPGSVKYIGDYAFANAKELKSVTLNKGTEEIGEGAFCNCDRLRFIHMPTNLYSVGDNAFKNCDKLASVILNDELQVIGSSAFAECPVLRGIVIPEHTETIGDYAFADCSALEYAYIWNAQPLGSNVFINHSLVRVYTVLGSDTYLWVREYDIPYVSYLDEDAFYTETMLRLDVEAGYIGYCEGEHGDIQWLTVCAADCENEGYIIGVCEYCTELLAEVHIPALGHNYNLLTHIPSTATSGAVDMYRCDRCGDVYSVNSEEQDETIVTQTVTGTVVFADNQTAESGSLPVHGVAVQLDGVTIARMDENGNFTAQMQSGTYNLTLHYAFGFDRIITVSVGDSAIDCGSIPIIGCDFNRDGAIDTEDDKLFRIIMFTRIGHESYVEYADMNHDGVINTADYAILKACTGIDAASYQYSEITIN